MIDIKHPTESKRINFKISLFENSPNQLNPPRFLHEWQCFFRTNTFGLSTLRSASFIKNVIFPTLHIYSPELTHTCSISAHESVIELLRVLLFVISTRFLVINQHSIRGTSNDRHDSYDIHCPIISFTRSTFGFHSATHLSISMHPGSLNRIPSTLQT